MIIFLMIIIPLLFVALQIFAIWLRHRLLVNDIKKAIIEAELEIRKGNFGIK